MQFFLGWYLSAAILYDLSSRVPFEAPRLASRECHGYRGARFLSPGTRPEIPMPTMLALLRSRRRQ
ncbi:MAG: hypothetical protein HKP32_01290 [Woeseia sp.]|nr:hypothetical protein [Woeseia sp.]MBT8095941.1 hypothetical protein [Woeseia sp.]NNL53767.1 hypothetical protein [Woeseia sp.]